MQVVYDSKTIRRISKWIIPSIAILSVLTWVLSRERLPNTIRFASAQEGGLYYMIASQLKPLMEERTGSHVEVIKTLGTIENSTMLREGKADLAILQSSAVVSHKLSAVAPLYHDVTHVVARQNIGINTISDLKGRAVSIGPEGSGMRRTAEQVLAHYHISTGDLKHNESYFLSMATNTALEAAVITTGITNPDLGSLLVSGHFKLIPIEHSEALKVKHPYFTLATIPSGLFAPGVPEEEVQTVASVAFLAVNSEASDLVVEAALSALYEDYQPAGYPPTIPLNKAEDWFTIPLHSAAVSYRDPHRGLELFGRFVEWLAALKELLVAIAAGLYLAWSRWRKLKKSEEETAYQKQRDMLDAMLDQTIQIERAHMSTNDPDKLSEYLDQVTDIKLKALDELTDQNLRGDRQFSIFLMQCSNLIRKIQQKCIYHLQKK